MPPLITDEAKIVEAGAYAEWEDEISRFCAGLMQIEATQDPLGCGAVRGAEKLC